MPLFINTLPMKTTIKRGYGEMLDKPKYHIARYNRIDYPSITPLLQTQETISVVA